MSSLPSRIDEEDQSGAAHVKFKKDDTADHSLTEPKRFIEERMRQADRFSRLREKHSEVCSSWHRIRGA